MSVALDPDQVVLINQTNFTFSALAGGIGVSQTRGVRIRGGCENILRCLSITDRFRRMVSAILQAYER